MGPYQSIVNIGYHWLMSTSRLHPDTLLFLEKSSLLLVKCMFVDPSSSLGEALRREFGWVAVKSPNPAKGGV
jgi:hypothetical protein